MSEDFIKGSIYGHLIGDAIGFPLKNISVLPKYFDMYGSSSVPKGTYSDAGAMMLCTISAINECHRVSAEEILDNLQDWYLQGYLASNNDCMEIKPNVIQALTNYTNSFPPDKCGITDDKQNNNAALVRMLPIALFYANKSIDDLIDNIHLLTKLTNAQLDNQVCCVLYGLLIRNILLHKKEKIFELLKDYYKTKKQPNNIKTLNSIQEWKQHNTPSGTEYVIDSFWSAWQSYSGSNSFDSCIETAVKLRNSCDDTACLAGSLFGLTEGFNNISEEWVNNLRLSFEAIEEINKFVDFIRT